MCRLLLLVMFAGSIFCLPVEEPFISDPYPPLPPRLTTVQNLTDANGYLTLAFEPMHMIVGQKGLASQYRVLPLIPAISRARYNTNKRPEESKSGWVFYPTYPDLTLWTVLDQNLFLKLIPVREGFQGCQSTDPFSALFAQVLDWFNNNPNCLNNAKAEPIKLDSEQAESFGFIDGTPAAVPLPIGGGVTAQIIGVIAFPRRSPSNKYSVVRQWADHYAQTLIPPAGA